MVLRLCPSDIYFSQSTISCRFSNGRLLGETLDDLYDGRLYVNYIDPISVTYVDSRWVTWDNRRLWVFRELEKLGRCGTIPVNEITKIPYFRMSSKCGGRDVKVRGDPGGRLYKHSVLEALWTIFKVIGVGAMMLLIIVVIIVVVSLSGEN